jgi:hypothetical protein
MSEKMADMFGAQFRPDLHLIRSWVVGCVECAPVDYISCRFSSSFASRPLSHSLMKTKPFRVSDGHDEQEEERTVQVCGPEDK